MLQDRRDIDYSTASRAALDAFERAVECLHAYRLDPMAELQAAVQHDPAFVMAHIMRGGLLCTMTEKGVLPLIRDSIAAAEAHAAEATERERRHIAAVKAWADGDLRHAVDLWGRIVIDHPRDTLALQLAHVGDFYLGQAAMLRDRPVHALRAFDTDTPGYGYLLGMHAFGLEETGLYRQAEESGRRAVELNGQDAWAVHAVAHVLEMEGRAGEGVDWLAGTQEGWAEHNMFAYHNWWHRCLFHLQGNDEATALRLLDERVRPQPSAVALEMLDATAMLWRLTLRGVDVGSRWEELADKWQATIGDRHYAFNDAHAMFALVGAGRLEVAEALLRNLKAASKGGGTNAEMTREVGLPLCTGILAFGRGDFAGAVDALLDVRPRAQRFGGSHAQRDIIALTCLEAAHRGGLHAVEAALLAERLDAKPQSPFNLRLKARCIQN
jgi:tetratricopeptide (TPR) repeat protein